jgi:hypothetical protein
MDMTLPQLFLANENIRGTPEFENLKSQYTTRGLVLLTLQSGVIFDKPIEDYGVDEWISSLQKDDVCETWFVRYYYVTKQFSKLRDICYNNISSIKLYELTRDNLLDEDDAPDDLYKFLSNFTRHYEGDIDDDQLEEIINSRDEFNIMRFYTREQVKTLMRRILKKESLCDLDAAFDPHYVHEAKFVDDTLKALENEVIEYIAEEQNYTPEEALDLFTKGQLNVSQIINVSSDEFLTLMIAKVPYLKYITIERDTFNNFPSLYLKKNLPTLQEFRKYIQDTCVTDLLKNDCGLLSTDFE